MANLKGWASAFGARVQALTTAARQKGMVSGVLLFLLGAVVAGFIALPMQDWWSSTKGRPFVAVILSNSDPNFTIPMELRTGIQQGQASPPSIPTPRQEFVEVHVLLSSLTAEDTRRVVRTGCLEIPDCIAIVGASDSTTTTAALEEILLARPQRRPALIMPIATATSLTNRAAIANFRPVLRLVPNNNDQAVQIKSFIANRAPSQRVTVLVDPENREYSNDLAELIVQAVRDNGGEATRVDYEDGQTLAEANRLGLREQDFIVFVGTSTNGLNVIQDMKRLEISVPIIFTDGNTVQEVIDQSLNMPGPAYFLTPVAELNNFREPGYTAIGRDTYALLSAIFSQSRRLTRSAVAEFVAEHKHEISLERGAAGRYRFDQDGENDAMHFRIFRVVDGHVQIETGY